MQMLVAVIALFVASLLLEWLYPLGQAGGYHAFADSRTWHGIPNAADVLSNVPIFLAGLANVVWERSQREPQGKRKSGVLVAGVGLMLTGIGSAYYHYAPSDATLVWDRLPLAVVFAGVLLTAWDCAAPAPPDRTEVALLVLASIGSVAFWAYLGSLWPYGILQFGGMAALLYLALRKRLVGARAWWGLIVLYALAKAFELLDHRIWAMTHQVVSGHTIKHLMSAAAGFSLVWIAIESATSAPTRSKPRRP